MGYLELDEEYQGDDVQLLRREVHEFAKEEIRPVAREIDRMDADEYAEITERPSILWDLFCEMRELGYHRAAFPEEIGGSGLTARERHVMSEEIAWGSPGVSVAFGVAGMPATMAAQSGDADLIEELVIPYIEDEDCEIFGCWGVTEPQHGSEHVQAKTLLRDGVEHPDASIAGPQAVAERDGGEYVINGQKSSWASAGPMATHCALHVNMQPEEGDPGDLCIVPLDAPGVEQGDPIQKLGERDNPQGELVFEDVRIPERNVIATSPGLHPDTGSMPFSQTLCRTSNGMAVASTGLARAAFEEALGYAREREQGGKPIAEHQSVKEKLYDMFEKVETARAYSRRIAEHQADPETPASYRHSLAAQVYCKRIAFDVAHEAVQIHGANGITKDYLVEKLFRDARVKLIEDGTIEVLGLESATDVVENYDIA